ncbi:hypothetical protein [Mesorhizobium sp.]|uniref:hypothetical protein n=1 Tax=Mesorhizobium sp. TaxID=1871066 RepID=UPI00257A0275|nr:hypothetical protein [Mesorhizobium sp.]
MNMIKHPAAASPAKSSSPYAKFPILEMDLEPLHELLRQGDVSELSVNRPGEIFVERLGAKEMERISDAKAHRQMDSQPRNTRRQLDQSTGE